MSAVIRPATPADAKAMSAIARAAFGEGLEPDPTRLARALSQGLNLVAVSSGRVVGFAGNFLTRSRSSALRFELDLLAVAERARGAGIGAALVAASVAAAKSSDADMIRALVASQNRAMQRLCRAGGFERDRTRRTLYVSDASRGLGAAVVSFALLKDAHLAPVCTLTYSGIWLEGAISQAAIDEARQRASADDMFRIGAVVPRADARLEALLLSNGFGKAGDFDWWAIRL